MTRIPGKRPHDYSALDYLVERFSKFLSNDWVHLEKKVARLQGQMILILGFLGTILSLLVYLVIRELELML